MVGEQDDERGDATLSLYLLESVHLFQHSVHEPPLDDEAVKVTGKVIL